MKEMSNSIMLAQITGLVMDKFRVKYVICLDINEQVNPGSKIWLPNVRSFLKPYCGPC